MASLPRQDGVADGIQPNQYDIELVDMVRGRNARCAGALYRHLRPAVERSLARVLGSHETEHDDLMQLSFEQIVRSILSRQYAGNCSLCSWASVIATRVAFAELRRRYRSRRFFVNLPAETVAAASPEVDGAELFLLREQLKFVRLALSRLTPERASVLLLHDVEGYQLDEIAQLLRITLPAAQSRLVRARKQFLAKYHDLAPGHVRAACRGNPGRAL